tara:strand:- start:98 stop:256 length:159 start_codon:yes stop_codon:yes gene_type:complete
MVTKFNTSKSMASGTNTGGSKLFLFLGLAVGGFLLYKYVIKPKLDANKDEDS